MREILVALPGDTDDIYCRHQQVWSAMSDVAQRGQDFLYAMVSSRLARVRSAKLDRGTVSEARAGAMALTVVAGRRLDNSDRLTPLTEAEIAAWLSSLLPGHGLAVGNLVVERVGTAHGIKVDRSVAEPRQMRIWLPFAHVRFDAAITNPALAALAWRDGVGRGRRFGFGMLRQG